MPETKELIAGVINQPGRVAVMATDTVYGLIAKATDQSAVLRLYALKDRQAKPGTVLAADIEQLVGDLKIARRYLKAVESFWPGAVSVAIPINQTAGFGYLTQGKADLAIRIPDNDFVRSLLSLTGPLLTSSANLPGQPTAATVAQAKAYFGASVDAYFDGGDLAGRLPSTVIRMADDAIEVLRAGAVKISNQS
jgi:tRNA threonylcarbamoyl adenosine modification protein (Sua5/YciO/YrdC/YwlC family)